MEEMLRNMDQKAFFFNLIYIANVEGETLGQGNYSGYNEKRQWPETEFVISK